MVSQSITNGQKLEELVINRINESYLIERKSFEVLNADKDQLLVTTPEVIDIARDSLQTKGIDVTKKDETTGWEKYWAREMAAARIGIAFLGNSYQRFLPGRSLHHTLLAHNITSTLINGNGESDIKNKKIAELGAGSCLSAIFLAQKGASVSCLDESIMAHEFGKYLAEHYDVSDKVELVHGDYFSTTFRNKEFDVVYNEGVLEHLNKRQAGKLLEEMNRITKPGGYIIIAVPNENSPFYKSFKQEEKGVKADNPDIIQNPVENTRYNLNPRNFMEKVGLPFIREDGILVAPSVPVNPGEILPKEDLIFFKDQIPDKPAHFIGHKITAWDSLEHNADINFRIKYGWSRLYVAQKPE